MDEKITFIRYKYEEDKYIYTFNGNTNGNCQTKMIMEIKNTEPESKIYVITGCDGKMDGKNWSTELGKCLFERENLMIGYYDSLNEVSEPLKNYYKQSHLKIINIEKLNKEKFLEIIKKKKGHVILGYCFSDSDVVVRECIDRLTMRAKDMMTCNIPKKFKDSVEVIVKEYLKQKKP